MNGTDVALDHTIQLTNVWLKRLATDHHLGEKHLGAQLPILVRGIYYEGWHLSECPRSDRHVDEFLAHVAAELLPMFPCDALGVAKAVFDLLWKELDFGEIAKVIDALPVPLRNLWPQIAKR